MYLPNFSTDNARKFYVLGAFQLKRRTRMDLPVIKKMYRIYRFPGEGEEATKHGSQLHPGMSLTDNLLLMIAVSFFQGSSRLIINRTKLQGTDTTSVALVILMLTHPEI
jgi:hypothetical protein